MIRCAAVAAIALLANCTAHHDEELTIWHAYSGAEREVLERSAARWTAAHPELPLHPVYVPYDAFADKLSSAVPNGNGPDLFVYANDRLGDWTASGILEPIGFWIDAALLGKYDATAIKAMTYHGALDGLPLTMKSLALFYRTDLVPTAPKTTDELIAMAPSFSAHGAHALAYANDDLYGHAPWLFGMGGGLLDDKGAPAIVSDAAVKAMELAHQLVTSGTVPAEISSSLLGSLFNHGNVGMVISGPWFIADIDPKVPWQVTSLPIVSATGHPAAPLLGVEGVMMSSRTHHAPQAFAAMAMLADDTAAIDRAIHARQVVPNAAAFADATVQQDPVLAAFREQARHAVAMSAEPALRVVWTPYQTALGEVLAGRADARTSLQKAATEISQYLAPRGGSK